MAPHLPDAPIPAIPATDQHRAGGAGDVPPSRGFRRVSRRTAILLVVGIISLKLALFFHVQGHHPEGFYPPDAPSYVVPAGELVAHGTFTHGGRPVLFRTPGYSVFLAPFIAVWGTDRAHRVVLAQIVLTLLVAGMAYLGVRALGGQRSEARVAFLVVLVDPAWVMTEFVVVSEVVYATLLMASLVAVARYERTGRNGYLLLSGLTLTAAAYVRPIALYLGVLFLGAVAVGTWRRRRWRGMLAVGAAIAFNVLALGAWELRNAHEFGEAIFSSVQGRNLYAYNAAAVRARAEGLDYRAVHEACLRDRVSDNPAIQARYETRKGLEILARYPGATVAVTLKGLVVNLFDPGTGAVLNLLGIRKSGSGIIYRFQNMSPIEFLGYLWHNEMPLLVLTALGGVWIVAFWILALLGLLRTRRAWQPVVTLMVLVIAYHLVVSAGPASTFRFRTPVVPVVAMLIGPGFYSLVCGMRRLRSNRVRDRISDRAT